MRLSFFHLSVAVGALGLIGAGCAPITSPKIAEPFRNFPSQQTVPEKQGFGALPTLLAKPSTATVTLEEIPPTPPNEITVLHLRSGLPNETEFRNIAGALGLPGTLLGDLPQVRSLNLSWADPMGMTWTYDAAKHALRFQAPVVESPLTLQSLPPTADLIRIATTFFQTHLLAFSDMLDPQMAPDWNNWWAGQQEAGMCMTSEAVAWIREDATHPEQFTGFPPLPPREGRLCSATEFPNQHRILFPAAKDGLEIVQMDGSSVEASHLIADATRRTIVSGVILSPRNADRSDYLAVDLKTLEERFAAGGLSGASGDIRIKSYSKAYVQQDDFLIPVMIGHGFRKVAEDREQGFRMVVPLVR